MEVEQFEKIKQEIGTEKKRQENEAKKLKIETEKKAKEKRQKEAEKRKKNTYNRSAKKIYEIDLSETMKACIYQSLDNEFYLEEKDDQKTPKLYGHDEKKLTLEQAIDIGGEEIATYYKEKDIVNNGTILREASMPGTTVGYGYPEWDFEAWECQGKCYFIERLYEAVGEISTGDAWWVPVEDRFKINEVSKDEMEKRLGRTIEELKRGSEIWEKGKIVEETSDGYVDEIVKEFEGRYAGHDSKNLYQFVEMGKEEVLQRIEKIKSRKGEKKPKITLASLSKSVANYFSKVVER